jgi:hypothetical protein
LAKGFQAVCQITRVFIQFFAAHRKTLVHVNAVVAIANQSIDVAQVLLVFLNDKNELIDNC